MSALRPLQRAELVEPQDDGVVERRRSVRPQVLRRALQGSGIPRELLEELGPVAELEHEALVLLPHQVLEELGGRLAHERHPLLHRAGAVDDEADVQRQVLGDLEPRHLLGAAVFLDLEVVSASGP